MVGQEMPEFMKKMSAEERANIDAIAKMMIERNPENKLAALRAENQRLLELLQSAVNTIKVWHGDVAWDIYYEHSPEMKPIFAALADTQEVT